MISKRRIRNSEEVYLNADLTIALGPLKLLDPLLDDLLCEKRHSHFCELGLWLM